MTSFDRSVVNASNIATPDDRSGVAEPDATNVSVVVSDTKGDTVTFPDVVPSGGSFTTAPMDVSGLVDGTLTATPTFTVRRAAGPVRGRHPDDRQGRRRAAGARSRSAPGGTSRARRP